MRVGLNAEPLFQRIPTGVGVYALALCRGLVEIGHADDLVFFHADHDEAPSEMDGLPVDRVAFTLSRDRLYDAWMADRRPAPQSITGHLDVVHSTGPAIPPAGGAALVVTVHDLAPIRFPDRYPRRARALHKRGAHIAAAEAARIICPSRSTALDVEEFYGVERDRIRVIPHGVDVAGLGAPNLSVGDAGRRWERRGIAEPYVLWVGPQEQRKNVTAGWATRWGRACNTGGSTAARSSARARCPAASWPPSTPGRRCSSTRRSTRGSGCRCWRPWPAAPRS